VSSEIIPERIDVFVDGSWLGKSSNNNNVAMGWGAVVVEAALGGELRWHVSGKGGAHDAQNTIEISAVIHGLEAVKERLAIGPETNMIPRIVVHTDQLHLPRKLEKYHGKDPLLGRLWELKEELQAEIVFTKAERNIPILNTHELMNHAHDLANAESAQMRYEAQGYIGMLGNPNKQYTGVEAEQYIASLRESGWKGKVERAR